MSDEAWDSFMDEHTNTMWFDSTRTKTLTAMRVLHQRMPAADRARLPASMIVFAPPETNFGEVFPWYVAADAPEERGVFVYLSPHLEGMAQDRVNYVVAHEFAHAILHQFHETPDKNLESEADELALTWGFARPKGML
jgi:hypothetical protein